MEHKAADACLRYPLFQEEEPRVRRLSDKMVTVRSGHPCVICLEWIPAGSRVRALTEVNLDDRTVATFRVCPSCCAAMAIAHEDNGNAICDRTALGIRLPIPESAA